MTQIPPELKRMMEIGSNIADGKQFDNTCPYCKTANLTYSFTLIRLPKGFYGLFVVCRNCKQGSHLTFTAIPAAFREELVLPYYQKLEDEAVGASDDNSR